MIAVLTAGAALFVPSEINPLGGVDEVSAAFGGGAGESLGAPALGAGAGAGASIAGAAGVPG